MPRDRLAELKGENANESGNDVDVEAGGGFVREQNPQLREFFDQVTDLRGTLTVIHQNTEKLQKLQQAALSIARENELNRRLAEIDALITETNRYAGQARSKLKAMQQQNEQFEREENNKPPKEKNNTDIRVRQTQYTALQKRFVDEMEGLQKVQAEYRQKFRDRMERQFLIVKPDATPQEIEQALDQRGPIFADQILAQSSSQQQRQEALQMLENIRERHEYIVRLEESLKELQQLFIDMATLVEAQGEMLNEIEHAVEQAVNYTEKGLGEMKKSVKYQKKARKKLCILMCCIIILLAIVLGPTLGVVLPKGN